MEDAASDIESPAETATAGEPVYRGRPLNFYVSKLKDASGARRITWLYAVGEFGSGRGDRGTSIECCSRR